MVKPVKTRVWCGRWLYLDLSRLARKGRLIQDGTFYRWLPDSKHGVYTNVEKSLKPKQPSRPKARTPDGRPVVRKIDYPDASGRTDLPPAVIDEAELRRKYDLAHGYPVKRKWPKLPKGIKITDIRKSDYNDDGTLNLESINLRAAQRRNKRP